MSNLETGASIGGYRIVAVLGEGGMGMVYRAVQEGLGRDVALKVIIPRLAADPDFRRRFQRESRLAASIQHPNVLPVYEAGEHDGVLFVSMQYVEGTDLKALIALEERLEPARAARLVAQVAAALDAAHARGLVHRDVKPANVLVARHDGEEHAYLTDFGISKHLESAALTETGALLGTVDYAAPEQLQGDPVDARADVYALGCMLFHALTSRVPFPRDMPAAKIFAHLQSEPPAPSEVVEDVPPAFDEVVARAMAKSPASRYQSAGALGRAAVAASGGTAAGGPARTEAHPTDAGATAAGRTAAGGTVAGPTLVPRSRRGRAVLAACAAAVVLAAAAIVVLGSGDSDENPRADATPRKTASVFAGEDPVSLSAGSDTLWVANIGPRTATALDPETGEPVGPPVKVRGGIGDVATADDAVWATTLDRDAVVKIDSRTGRSREFRLPGRPADIAVGEGGVWVSLYSNDSVARLDADSGKQVGGAIKVGHVPGDVAIGAGSVWVANTESDSVTRIDPKVNEAVGEPIPVGNAPLGIAVGAGAVWVANSEDDTVSRIDPASGTASGRPVDVGKGPGGIDTDGTSVWVATLDDDTVQQIDARTGTLVGAPIPAGKAPEDLVVAFGSVWVSNPEQNRLTRIDL